MRKFLFMLAFAIGIIAMNAQSAFDESFNELSEVHRVRLKKAVQLVDAGMTEAAMPDFDFLVQAYPKNYLVRYERMYNLYVMGRYDDVIKESKFLLGHKHADALAYQMIGNAYDYLGKRKKAEKVYLDGLKRFPDSGYLYLELGNLAILNEDFNKAIGYFTEGIVVQPEFASNYYRAALIDLIFNKAWGLVYAESAVLLDPNNESRMKDMTDGIIGCLKESIKLELGEKVKLEVTISKSRKMNVDSSTHMVYLGFEGVYEGLVTAAMSKYFIEKIPFVFSLSQITELRKNIVELYYSLADNIYGDGMYLLEFQKKVIDAGHWDAYNHWLFMQSYTEEFDQWYAENSDALTAFIDWYNSNPFTLGDGRSVDSRQIFRDYTPVDMLQALMIQNMISKAALPDSDSDPED